MKSNQLIEIWYDHNFYQITYLQEINMAEEDEDEEESLSSAKVEETPE